MKNMFTICNSNITFRLKWF